ncbi:MAG TPA: Vms1/Ankzf1 family peptidyl-tRNA hydrolase [Actinomycetota bacterium]
MMELDHSLLRTLAAWDPAGVPVTSLYLTVDGRRYPRKSDYEVRLDELLRQARSRSEGLDRNAVRSVEQDLEAISAYVKEDFERGDTRGLALFSSKGAGLWEEVRVPRPVRDRAVTGPRADLLPLEQVLATYHPVCAVLIDFSKARLFLCELGRIREVSEVWDEVPGRHDQGGWAQMRMQRHVDDHRQKHVKNVADTLFRMFKRQGFEHLILAGPAEAHAELERELHDYLRQRIKGRVALPMTATTEDVLARCLEVEEGLERDREREQVRRLLEAAASGSSAVTGLAGTLGALADGRVGELVVWLDLAAPGAVCASCGRLSEHDSRCARCGGRLDRVSDVVEAAVAEAFRQGCRVETVLDGGQLEPVGGIGALLRF